MIPMTPDELETWTERAAKFEEMALLPRDVAERMADEAMLADRGQE
jgi:hypothetical protein